jgi:hypothetical protein
MPQLTYQGDGATFYTGFPMRDLDTDEPEIADQLIQTGMTEAEAVELLTSHGLYAVAGDPKPVLVPPAPLPVPPAPTPQPTDQPATAEGDPTHE